MLRWTAGTRARAEREWRESRSYAPWLKHSLPSQFNNMEYNTRTKHLQNESEPAISQIKVNSCVHATSKESLPSQEELKNAKVDKTALQATPPLLSQSSSTSSTAAKAELLVKEMLEAKQKHNDYTLWEEFKGKDNSKNTSETTRTSADTKANEIEKKEFTFAHERVRLLKAHLENNTSTIDEFHEKKKYEKNKKNNNTTNNSNANNYTVQKECTATKESQNTKRLRESQRLRWSADEIALQWPLRQRYTEEYERKRYRRGSMTHYSRPSSCISSHSSNVSSISTHIVEPNLKMNARKMNMQCKTIIKEEQQEISEKLLKNKMEARKQNDANVIYDDYAENKFDRHEEMENWSTSNVNNYKSKEIEQEEEEKESTFAFASLPLQPLPEEEPSSSELSTFSSSVISTSESIVMPIVTDNINNIFCTEESRWPFADAADVASIEALEAKNEDVREELRHKHYDNNEVYWEEEPVNIFSLPCTTIITNVASPQEEVEIHSVAEYDVANNLHDSHHVEWNEYCKYERERQSYEIFDNINGNSSDNYNSLYGSNVCFNVNDNNEQCTPFVDNPLIDVTCDNLTESINDNNIFDYSCKKNSSSSNNKYSTKAYTKRLEISPTSWEKEQQQYEESPVIYKVSDWCNPLHLPYLYDNNFEYDNNKDYINPENIFDGNNQSRQEPCELETQNMLSSTYTDNANMYMNRTALPDNRIRHVEMLNKVKGHNRETCKYVGISERCRQFRERCRRRKHL